MTTQHTPGPWQHTQSSFGETKYPSYLISTDGRSDTGSGICHTIGRDEANARLIAAAPEMIHALKLAADELNKAGCDCEDSPLQCPVCAVNAAIAKATGGQP